jgi:hypothetical protein
MMLLQFAVKCKLIRVLSWPYIISIKFSFDTIFTKIMYSGSRDHKIKQCHGYSSQKVLQRKIQTFRFNSLALTQSSQVNCESPVWETKVPNRAAHPVLSSVCICTSGRTFLHSPLKSITRRENASAKLAL